MKAVAELLSYEVCVQNKDFIMLALFLHAVEMKALL
jgi:hypothetical protein